VPQLTLLRPARVLAALLGAVALLLTACTSSGSPTVTITNSNGSEVVSTPPGDSSSSTKPAKPTKPVHIKTLEAGAGEQYGVGMPVIAFFSKKIKSGKALQGATKVTADGRPVAGAWYFEYSDYYKHSYPIEGHWRPEHYWPAHSKIHVDIAAKGVSAGGNLAFNDSITLDFFIGAKNIGVVNNITHHLVVTSDGKQKFDVPVSLGATSTPTRHGIKVIMEKLPTVCMHDVNNTYYECGIQEDQRLTYDGEYLHSAPWNVGNIQSGVNSSNGCTNLLPDDATALYHFLEVGDVVVYPNANGKAMQIGDGYGDWNIPWGTWQTGGLVSTTT
jgi:lipoprotein-anchoring transpeptidase ErfK/SrfK